MAGRSTYETPALCLSVETRGSEIFVTAAGEVDLASSPAVDAMFAEAVTGTCRRVVIDVSGVTFLDAAGLRALRAGTTSDEEGVEICLLGPSRPVRRILELIEVCALAETPSGALNGGGRSSSTSIEPVVQEVD